MRGIITITGHIGSGKSTVGRSLAASLGYQYVSTGSIQRQLATRRGLTSLGLNELSMHDRRVDDEIDSYLERLNTEGDRLVLDSRLAWHFVHDSFKVFVHVDPCVGARRVLANPRAEEEHHGLADAVRNNLRRKALEDRRFAQLYGVRCDAPGNYHLVVDSTWVPAERLAEVILRCFSERDGGGAPARGYLCPKSLYPTASTARVAAAETSDLRASMERSGFASDAPVEAVQFSQYYFILDGHRRVSCALGLGLDLVPCVIRSADEVSARGEGTAEEEVAGSLDRAWIGDWEAAHGFSFASYPDKSGSPRLD